MTKRKGPPRPGGRPQRNTAALADPEARAAGGLPDAPEETPKDVRKDVRGDAWEGIEVGTVAGEIVEPGADTGQVTVTADGGAGAPSRRQLPPHWAKRLEVLITVAGLVVATLLALALGTIEAFLAPLRLNGTGMRLPVSLVLALVTNPLLGWFAFVTTGRRLAALLPAGAWCVVWILAAGRTSEGDLLITDDNWVGLLTLFAGPMAFAVGIYVAALRQRAALAGARPGGGPAGNAPSGAAGDDRPGGTTPTGRTD